MGSSGYNSYKWGYGPLLITSDGAHFVGDTCICHSGETTVVGEAPRVKHHHLVPKDWLASTDSWKFG